MRSIVVAATILALAGPATAAGTTYYVSPDGSDAAAGTSPAQPWRTLARAGRAHLRPGDSVLFRGGRTFGGRLLPRASGTRSAPIRFGSYGGGRANLAGGIVLRSRSWLIFDRLQVDTGNWRTAGLTRGISTAISGTGVRAVVVRGCRFVNVGLGLLLRSELDRDWTVTGTTIRFTRDSGILIYDADAPGKVGGSHMTFVRNRILDTGLDASLDYKKHAVYDIGRDIVWRDNVVQRFSEGGFSLRAAGNTLIGNTISDGAHGIFFSPYDSRAGTTTITSNRILRVSAGGIGVADSGLVTNHESFAIAHNTIVATGHAHGIRVDGTSGSVRVTGNDVAVAAGPALWIGSLPGGRFFESGNVWRTPSWRYLGRDFQTLDDYRSASGQGRGDSYVR